MNRKGGWLNYGYSGCDSAVAIPLPKKNFYFGFRIIDGYSVKNGSFPAVIMTGCTFCLRRGCVYRSSQGWRFMIWIWRTEPSTLTISFRRPGHWFALIRQRPMPVPEWFRCRTMCMKHLSAFLPEDRSWRWSLWLTGTPDSFGSIRMESWWWRCTGRSTSSRRWRSIIASIAWNFRRSRLMCAVTPTAPIWRSPG